MMVRIALVLALVCPPAYAGGKQARAKAKTRGSEFARHAGAQTAGVGLPFASFLGQRTPAALPPPPTADGKGRPELLEGPAVEMP